MFLWSMLTDLLRLSIPTLGTFPGRTEDGQPHVFCRHELHFDGQAGIDLLRCAAHDLREQTQVPLLGQLDRGDGEWHVHVGPPPVMVDREGEHHPLPGDSLRGESPDVAAPAHRPGRVEPEPAALTAQEAQPPLVSGVPEVSIIGIDDGQGVRAPSGTPGQQHAAGDMPATVGHHRHFGPVDLAVPAVSPQLQDGLGYQAKPVQTTG